MTTSMEMKRDTLEAIEEILAAVQSPDWHHALDAHKNDTQLLQAAFRFVGIVGMVRSRLRNAVLGEISGRLAQNEDALKTGIKKTGEAIKSLDDIKSALKAFSDFVSVVGRVVTLLPV